MKLLLLLFLVLNLSCELTGEEISGSEETQSTGSLQASNVSWSDDYEFTANTSLVASWTAATSSLVDTQDILLFDDIACTSSTGSDVLGLAKGASSHTLNFSSGDARSFKILTKLSTGDSNSSECSKLITINTNGAQTATSLSWLQGNPSGTTSIDSSWTVSISFSIASQRVEYYTDSSCSNLVNSYNVSAFDSSHTYTGTDGSTYYFRVITVDGSGSEGASVCSSPLSISI